MSSTAWVLGAERWLVRAGALFAQLCSLCLLGMLALTAATILLRPFGVSFYWIFPWTMVLFVWLSFFGFFAAMVFARDIRIDFLARRFGDPGMTLTRVIGQAVMLFVLFHLLRELPDIVANQSGSVDGALLPFGPYTELPRRFLSLPLLLSCIGIVLALLLDIAKLLLGLPERFGGGLPGSDPDDDPLASASSDSAARGKPV